MSSLTAWALRTTALRASLSSSTRTKPASAARISLSVSGRSPRVRIMGTSCGEALLCRAKAVQDFVLALVVAVFDDFLACHIDILHACIAARKDPAVENIIALSPDERRMVQIENHDVRPVAGGNGPARWACRLRSALECRLIELAPGRLAGGGGEHIAGMVAQPLAIFE